MSTIPNNFFDSLKPSNSMLIVYIVIANAAVILNIVCIAVIAKQKQRIKPFEILLIHLMVIDIIVAVAATLLTLALLVDLKEIGEYELIIIAHLFVATSYEMTLVIFFISINRLFAVKYPLKHRFHMTRRNTLAASIAMWLVSVVYFSVTLIPKRLKKQSGNPFEIPDTQRITFIVISCSFAAIFIAINLETLRLILKSSTAPNGATINRAATRSRNRQLLLTTTLIVICFCICTAPRVYQFAMKRGEIRTLAALIANSIMNPILYFAIAEVRRRNSGTSRREQEPTDT